MKNELIELEKKFFYRLIKVFYITFLIIFLTGIIIVGYNSKPKQYVDNEKSYLVCENGLYSFPSLGIYFWNEGSKIVSNNFDEKANIACKENNFSDNGITGDKVTPEILRAQLKRQEMLRQTNHPAYELSAAFITFGSWIDVFKWWIFGASIVYMTLNIARETIIYIAFGNKFNWSWLRSPYYLCKSLYSITKK